MALDPNKRQKKLERKKAKERKAMALARQRKAQDPFARAAGFPVLDSFYMDSLWTQGLGAVVISRQLSNGQIAYASFLVDAFCLGVKDVQFDVIGPVVYEEKFLAYFKQMGGRVKISPACARKLVEESVAYAQSFGLLPHSDYQKARAIFGDIDASACTETFTFGKDGKPVFISGPHDSPEFSRRVAVLLQQHAGPGGSDHVINLSPYELNKQERLLLEKDTEWDDEKENDDDDAR